MKTMSWETIDKSDWGSGPWQEERCDKLQWQDEATRLPCLAVRSQFGAWCGYVGVAEGHALFDISYSTCPEKCGQDYCEHTSESVLQVHGGITFSRFCQDGDEAENVCHVPGPGEPDRVFWFGFDCNHAFDYAPGMAVYLREAGVQAGVSPFGDIYRDLEYVKAECARLAAQLAAVKPAPLPSPP